MAGRTQPCRTHKTSTWNLIKLIKMGHKILDVKADIHEDVEAYFTKLDIQGTELSYWQIKEELLDVVDKHFEKIEQ